MPAKQMPKMPKIPLRHFLKKMGACYRSRGWAREFGTNYYLAWRRAKNPAWLMWLLTQFGADDKAIVGCLAECVSRYASEIKDNRRLRRLVTSIANLLQQTSQQKRHAVSEAKMRQFENLSLSIALEVLPSSENWPFVLASNAIPLLPVYPSARYRLVMLTRIANGAWEAVPDPDNYSNMVLNVPESVTHDVCKIIRKHFPWTKVKSVALGYLDRLNPEDRDRFCHYDEDEDVDVDVDDYLINW